MKLRLTIILFATAVAAAAMGIGACNKKDAAAHRTTPLTFAVPNGFPQPKYNFRGNPLTEEGFNLGRQLFYDGLLSADGTASCGSCHQQQAAFGTYDHDLSHGVHHSHTDRNAPVLSNMAWQTLFRHDGRQASLETLMLSHLTAPNEMGETPENVVKKLKNSPLYPPLFRAAFGDAEINADRMLKALAQFTVSLVSADSKYDKVKRGEASFTFFEQAGYTVFQAQCASCHQEPLFTDGSFRDNGIGLNPFLNDGGRSRVTGRPDDSLKFKVPTLRNVALTYPYMHDGRYTSLAQSIDHYRSGIQQTPNLDPSLRMGLPLSASDIVNLTAFLKTLTDSSFITNTRFAAP